MDSVLTSVVVTTIFLAIAAAVGGHLGRVERPYGVVKLTAHIILFLLVSGGVAASSYKLQGIAENKLPSTLSLYLAGLALLANLAIGVLMIAARQRNQKLISAHKLSTLIMAVSIVASAIFLSIKV